jgi:hypothetical protein
MANCIKLNQVYTNICKTVPGISEIFLANQGDISKVFYSTDNSMVSGFTFTGTGTTYFYKIIPPKNQAQLMDDDPVDMGAGTYKFIPKLTFPLNTLNINVWTMYTQLVMGGNFTAVVKYNNGDWFCAAPVNGLTTNGNQSFGSDPATKIGATIAMEGLEPYPIQRLSTDLSNAFESTYVVSI